MRKISLLCRKLKRITGRSYCVQAVSRGRYSVYLFDDVSRDWNFVASSFSVNGVVSYLNSQFL